MRWILFLPLFTIVACGSDGPLAPPKPGGELVVVTRNSPTTYYFEEDRATGFDYELAKAFADSQNMSLRIKVAFTLEELITGLEAGEAHLAAAGLTLTDARAQRFYATVPYLEQRPLIIYKAGLRRPRSMTELVGRDIVVLAGSSHVEALNALKENNAALTWREIRSADSLELMALVAAEKAELAVVDSSEFDVQQHLYPRLVAALRLTDVEPIVWYLPRRPEMSDLLGSVNAFFDSYLASDEMERLRQRHFGNVEHGTRIQSFTFQQQIRRRLPDWQPLIEAVAIEFQMDWRLLAAVAYQESHWNPRARSPTGVRGMMMITQITARELGITDRMDPEQSLRGGARFLKNLLRRIPQDIVGDDRTWMALAAYNIGMGHLEDARILAERNGLDPHKWRDVREQLPSLQNPQVYPNLRFGFARGREAVTYVDNIRHYWSVLKLTSLDANRIKPPLDPGTLLPEELATWVPLAF